MIDTISYGEYLGGCYIILLCMGIHILFTPRNIKNLIFDLDGTLIDSSEGVVAAVNHALQMLGDSPRKPEEIKKYIGMSLETMFRDFSKESYLEFHKYFQEFGIKVIADSARPLDGVDETLKLLYHGGYKLGIGTQKERIHLEKIIQKLGWGEIIFAGAGADDVKHGKPAPDIYLRVMELMKGGKENSLVIGDTVNDVLSARAAGLPIVAVLSPFGDNSRLAAAQPDILISNIRELPKTLGIRSEVS